MSPLHLPTGFLLLAAVLLAGCSLAPDKSGSPPEPLATGTLTFGTQPCGKLVSLEEVQAATRQKVALLNVLDENTCGYEDSSGFPIITVIISAGSDCSVLGADVEAVPGVPAAFWSDYSETACVTSGDTQARILMGTVAEGVDKKTAGAALIAAAAPRLP